MLFFGREGVVVSFFLKLTKDFPVTCWLRNFFSSWNLGGARQRGKRQQPARKGTTQARSWGQHKHPCPTMFRRWVRALAAGETGVTAHLLGCCALRHHSAAYLCLFFSQWGVHPACPILRHPEGRKWLCEFRNTHMPHLVLGSLDVYWGTSVLGCTHYKLTL